MDPTLALLMANLVKKLLSREFVVILTKLFDFYYFYFNVNCPVTSQFYQLFI